MIDRPIINPVARDDARKEPRIAVNWLGRLTMADGQHFAVKAVDVSRSGAGVLCEAKLRRQEPVELVLDVPDLPHLDTKSAVHVRAVVAYQMLCGAGWRTGLMFTNIKPEAVKIIEAWLARPVHSF